MLSQIKDTLITLTRWLLAALTTRRRATSYAYVYPNRRKQRPPYPRGR